ncbi:uncharacterized protein IUM83_18473 [Phytophthora cinnamomi]|uniref:uncharacterized protein n=1 Tax=Phytophthora cinnamomi TaxID=4785 RepID=UPI003559A015|nr:hypothetical protein IUM83_18473 [Phytophthora cinnamomi]
MAEAPGGDEALNPFDAPTSGRDPFPPFEAALADDQPTAAATEEEKEEKETELELQGAGSALDWSIDTLAELKPVVFSPLPQQKEANASGTPHGASGFFEDEKQYEVLRTPLPAARPSPDVASAVGRSRATPSPSPSPPLELHRRCRETIARCEARLRERQRKMDKLQAVLPPPTPKRSPRHRSSHPRANPPSRSTPPRPAKRNRLSGVATPNSDWKSPSTRPPMWSASPIAMVGSRQPRCATPATLQFDALTPSPLVKTPRSSTQPSSKLRLSFGLSPIAFPSPEQVQAEKIESDEDGNDEEKDASNEDTLPLSSTEESAASVSPESEKENGEHQAQRECGRQQQQGSSSSHASAGPSVPAAKKSVAPARRQRAFMEAMEAEARSSEPSSSSGRRSAQAASPSSILSLYQEARRLGMTDPQAQWQYVQTLRQSDQKER